QLNASYYKSKNAIIINKLVEEHNYSLVPYRKEFALSLRSISQEVLDTIKFLTQECNLGIKAQCWYLSKKFSDQPLYDYNLYKAICRYENQMGDKRENDVADIVKWLIQQQEQEPEWAIYIEFENSDKFYLSDNEERNNNDDEALPSISTSTLNL
ncbi:23768_t:CDS:2, partial [Gigaspora margarita]